LIISAPVHPRAVLTPDLDLSVLADRLIFGQQKATVEWEQKSVDK